MARGTTPGTAKSTSQRKVDAQRMRRVLSRLPAHGRTLLVDDNRFDLEIIRLKLGMVLGPGVEILTARSVAAAVDHFNRQHGRLDLLILNYRLAPDQTGLDLLGALQRCPHPHPAKTVLYSAKMEAKLAQDAAKAGFHAAVPADELDSMAAMTELVWRLVKPDIDWSASWRGLP